MGVRQLEQVSNAKRFFEVFPTLKVEKDIHFWTTLKHDSHLKFSNYSKLIIVYQ